MSDYIPMIGPLPGVQFIPSNGAEGDAFQQEWCFNCARDKELNGTCHAEGRDATDDDWCPIVAASYRGEAVEWRELDDGSIKCMAFTEAGKPIPVERCPHTADLFAEA